MLSFVWRDLVRNPHRTVASLAGVVLGVGLFSGVLFFIDGSLATMTQRALAPLSLDMQRVLATPLGPQLRLEERLAGLGPLRAGEEARAVLTVTNTGSEPANEVVVSDEPPPPLAHVRDSTTIEGRRLRDREGGSPLAQGVAGTGLNIGTVPPRRAVTLTYRVRARRPVADVRALAPRGRVSSREDVVPLPANAPAPPTPADLQARLGRIPGVAAVDRLAFVDLPPRSLAAGGRGAAGGVRLFAFDRAYQRRHPSIRLAEGAFGALGSALLSAEAARTLDMRPGGAVRLRLPGRRRPLTLSVSGILDLARARPLFSSRKTTKFEDFLYVPQAVVVSPETFDRVVIPAFRAARAARGRAVRSLPLLELDVRVDRGRLAADPAGALAQTRAIARAVRRTTPGRDVLIDNISNALAVARDDAAVGKRMFLFLGLPGVLLAAFLAAYTASVLAAAQRRDQATLRVRGAHRGHLLRILAVRTVIVAGAGSLVGIGLGLASAAAVLGSGALGEAAGADLAGSAAAAGAFGVVATGLALYVPGTRSLRREVARERGEMALGPVPAWRRWRLDFALLALAAAAQAAAFAAGAFDAPAGSVAAGRAVSLPSRLVLAPLVAWLGGLLLAVRLVQVVAARVPVPAPPRFGPVVGGTLRRSVRRRSWTLAGGVIGVGLPIAFGAALAVFSATYDAAKAADARFVVGSDLRVTPSVLGPGPRPSSYRSRLLVPGVAAATPVVFKGENAVLIGPDDQDTRDLAAIDPAGFRAVGPPDEGRAEALHGRPEGLLVQSQSAEALGIEAGDRVQVLVARGTERQRLARFDVVGLFERFPGFPEGVDLVANLGRYAALTRSDRADFFLVRAGDPTRARAALRAGPGSAHPLDIESTETAVDRDQSSLTALNVHGLVELDAVYTLAMSAAGIAAFVFGLLLQRRREYVTLRAQGIDTWRLQALVLAEASLVAACGVVAGVLVGTGTGTLLVHVLRPLFILDPQPAVPVAEIAALAAVAGAATLACALAATAMVRRVKPTELLRET